MTAVGVHIRLKNNSKTVLGTAHPYKFLETIKLAIENVNHQQFSNLSKKVEKFEIIDNKLNDIKKYIIEKLTKIKVKISYQFRSFIWIKTMMKKLF